jgi:hypothetical protein
MLSRIFPFIALGCAIFGWSDRVSGQAVGESGLSGRITSSPRGILSVKLKPVEKNPLATYDGYSTQSRPDGGFQFEDVEPGRYVLVAEGAGFLSTEYGADGPGQSGKPIDLKPGEHRTGVVFALTPKHAVCGKVTDGQGKPLAEVAVYAFAHLKGSIWLSGGVYSTTDDEGNYRLPDLETGEYFLWAGMSTWFTGSKNLTQTEAENLANAEPVQVDRDDGGGCRENIRIGPRLGYRGFKIRGEIAGDPSLAENDLVLSLLEVNPTGVARVAPPTETLNPEPSFDLWPMPVGHYRLILSSGRFPPNGFTEQPSFAIRSSQEITVGPADVNGITVAPDPLASLAGQVDLDGIGAAAACPTREKTHLRIQKDDDGQFQNVELTADGKFSFPQVPLGTYTVSLYPFLRGTLYVKSMLFDGHPVEGRKIQISSVASHSLDVVLSGDTAHASLHSAPGETIERYRIEGTHPKAFLSGRVTNVLVDAPWVKLWAVRFNSDRSYEYSTKPKPDGTFYFEDVDPGIYVLAAQGPGYTLSEYGSSYPRLEGKAITLSAGQHLAGLTLIAAPRKPILCGQITDDAGHPLPNVTVFATPSPKPDTALDLRSHADNSSSGTQVAKSVMVVSLNPPSVRVDNSGNFRFFDLKPGLYFIWADLMVPGGQTWTRRWTYYPSSPDLDDAQPVRLGFGPDIGCTHNIQMRSAATFHVRGVVPRDIAHTDGDYFDVHLVETNSTGVEGATHIKSALAPGDIFDFDDVRAGHYEIRLVGPYGKPQDFPLIDIRSGPCSSASHLVASRQLAVSGGDLNDVTMVPIAPVSVAGEIHFTDIPAEWRSFRVEAQTLTLSPVGEFSSLPSARALGGECPQRAQLGLDGKFTVANVIAGTYQVGVELAGVQGDELYLKSIVLNGQPVEGRRITLKPGRPTQLTMVVSNNGGELDVAVRPSGPPAEEYRYEEPCRAKMTVVPKVLLIPDTVQIDGSGILIGSFAIAGLVEISRVPPGHYFAVAGENFNLHLGTAELQDSPWINPEFLESVKALGTPVEVVAGQKIKLSLPSVTAQIQDLLANYDEGLNLGDHCAVSCSYDEFWSGAETAEAKKQ